MQISGLEVEPHQQASAPRSRISIGALGTAAGRVAVSAVSEATISTATNAALSRSGASAYSLRKTVTPAAPDPDRIRRYAARFPSLRKATRASVSTLLASAIPWNQHAVSCPAVQDAVQNISEGNGVGQFPGTLLNNHETIRRDCRQSELWITGHSQVQMSGILVTYARRREQSVSANRRCSLLHCVFALNGSFRLFIEATNRAFHHYYAGWTSRHQRRTLCLLALP
jgi:hypothetical protein